MVYLDYSATCPVVKYPQQLYRNVLGEGYFFNPNTNYAYKEKRLLSEAENRVKVAIGAKGGKVVFGGTSSQLIENLMNAITHVNYGLEVLCSNYEHDSFFKYQDKTFSTLVDFNERLQSTWDNTPVVMWQGVSNITGEIFPVERIGQLTHEEKGYYICDMTAMIGKAPIPANIDQWCDCAMWSGHKLGTELGIGAMWISDKLDKWLNGFKLHGTPNLAGALALTQAVEEVCDSKTIERNNFHWVKLANKFGGLLNKNNIQHTFVPLVLDDYTSAINAIRLPGFNARALQSYLASKEIYIGLGQSSCADEADRRILCQGYGLSEQEADEVIRISFGEDSNVEDVKVLVENICEFKKIYLDN